MNEADSLKIPISPKYMELCLEFFRMIRQWAPVLFTISMADLLEFGVFRISTVIILCIFTSYYVSIFTN